MQDIIEKVRKIFSNKVEGEIYLRENEKNRIKDFLDSKKSILHINGNPGTGKTCVVLKLLENRKFHYFNYFHEENLGKCLKNIIMCPKKSMGKIIVIDEFDKYYNAKRKECLRYLNNIEKKKIKVIAISNNLNFGDITFLPYGRDEIKEIIRKKIESESPSVIEENALDFISKKFEKSGDLRLVQKYIFEVLGKMNELPIRMCNLIEAPNESQEKNLQHEIIKKIVINESGGYQKYKKECLHIGIPELTKIEFEMVSDIYKNK